MVVSLADLFAPSSSTSRYAPDTFIDVAAAPRQHEIAEMAEKLLVRASSLVDVSCGGAGVPGIAGMPLHYVNRDLRNKFDCFLKDRIFAVITEDSSVCFRVPEDIAEDLLESGLCSRVGKNLITRPITNKRELEIIWKIILHVYWNVSEARPARRRKLWSEWVGT